MELLSYFGTCEQHIGSCLEVTAAVMCTTSFITACLKGQVKWADTRCASTPTEQCKVHANS